MESMEKNTAPERAAENELILKLSKPYMFEGEAYTEIDFSGLENITAGTLERSSKTVLQQSPSLNPAMLESTMPFCMELAVRVTKKPYEFFRSLPVQDAMKMKALITNFLYAGDGEE